MNTDLFCCEGRGWRCIWVPIFRFWVEPFLRSSGRKLLLPILPWNNVSSWDLNCEFATDPLVLLSRAGLKVAVLEVGCLAERVLSRCCLKLFCRVALTRPCCNRFCTSFVTAFGRFCSSSEIRSAIVGPWIALWKKFSKLSLAWVPDTGRSPSWILRSSRNLSL